MKSKEANRSFNDCGSHQPDASRVPLVSSQHPHQILSNDLYSAAREFIAAPARETFRRSKSARKDTLQSYGVKPLYTPEQRKRRDATRWTLVQGILAPLQFAVFVGSTVLVLRYLVTGEGFAIATASVVAKTLLLYAIMITGSIWEREVFGVYLFAPAFFWEDVFSFLVLALHSAYLGAVLAGYGDARQQMLLALAAYATYVINATQFLLKLRAARRDERLMAPTGSAA